MRGARAATERRDAVARASTGPFVRVEPARGGVPVVKAVGAAAHTAPPRRLLNNDPDSTKKPDGAATARRVRTVGRTLSTAAVGPIDARIVGRDLTAWAASVVGAASAARPSIRERLPLICRPGRPYAGAPRASVKQRGGPLRLRGDPEYTTSPLRRTHVLRPRPETSQDRSAQCVASGARGHKIAASWE